MKGPTRSSQQQLDCLHTRAHTHTHSSVEGRTGPGVLGHIQGRDMRGVKVTHTYRTPPPTSAVMQQTLAQGDRACTQRSQGLQRQHTRSSLRVFIVGSRTTSFTATICSSMAFSCTSLNSYKDNGQETEDEAAAGPRKLTLSSSGVLVFMVRV